jgi:hypothetical protein
MKGSITKVHEKSDIVTFNRSQDLKGLFKMVNRI